MGVNLRGEDFLAFVIGDEWVWFGFSTDTHLLQRVGTSLKKNVSG